MENFDNLYITSNYNIYFGQSNLFYIMIEKLNEKNIYDLQKNTLWTELHSNYFIEATYSNFLK